MNNLNEKEILFIENIAKIHERENNSSFVSVDLRNLSGLGVQECYDIGNHLKLLGLIKFSPTLGATAIVQLTYKAHEIIDAIHAREFRNKQRNFFDEDLLKIKKDTSETAYLLKKYPNSLKPYNEALDKLSKMRDVRNLADDLRLSLENLLRSLLSNNASLENNIAPILSELKKKEVSVEIRNLFQKVLQLYSDYQNNNVKHACDIEAIDSIEVGYLFEQTNIMIKFLVQILGGNDHE